MLLMHNLMKGKSVGQVEWETPATEAETSLNFALRSSDQELGWHLDCRWPKYLVGPNKYQPPIGMRGHSSRDELRGSDAGKCSSPPEPGTPLLGFFNSFLEKKVT